jgi:anti-anti-sigma regulatory factor
MNVADVDVRVVIAPAGDVAGTASAAFRRQLSLLSVIASADIVVDLGAVRFLDEAAARSIADATARLGRINGRLRVVQPQAQPRERLQAYADSLCVEFAAAP